MNSFKDVARHQVHHAVKVGRLIRPTRCENCLEPCKPEGHHEDYNKPLDVKWLCKDCHTAAHYPFRLKNLFGIKATRKLVKQEYSHV